MAEYTDVFTYDSEKLSSPLVILETDGEVNVLSFSETLDAGTYTIDGALTVGFSNMNDIFTARLTGVVTTPIFTIKVANDNEVQSFIYVSDVVHVGGLFVIDAICSIDGSGVADCTINSGIFRVRRVV